MAQEARKRGDELVRMSITMDAATRKEIRIAAAYDDMELSEWCAQVLKKAAQRRTGGDHGRSD